MLPKFVPGEDTEPTYCLGGRKKQSRELELIREIVVYRSHFMPSSHSTETSTLGPDLTSN